MALLQVTDFDLAKEDLDFIDEVKVSTNDQETSRLGNLTYTRIGALKRDGYAPATPGGVWVAGVTFNNYKEFLIYNNIVYVLRSDVTAPIITAATPGIEFMALFSRVNDDGIEFYDLYNEEVGYKFSTLCFRSINDMENLTSISGDVVNAPIGAALKVQDDTLTLSGYEVIDGADIQPGDTVILLSNGLYARELTYALDPSAGDPLRTLDQSNNAMIERKPDFKYFNGATYAGRGFGRSTIAQNGNHFYFDLTFPVQYIKSFSSETEQIVEYPINDPSSDLRHYSVLGADGRLYISPSDSNSAYMSAINTQTGEQEDIPLSGHTGSTKSFQYGEGVMSDNGIIYYFPQTSSGVMCVLKVDTINVTATYINLNVSYGSGRYGGGCVAPNGNIFLYPTSATTFIEYDVTNDTITEFGTTATTSQNKFESIRVGPDGLLYAIPNGEQYIYQIDSLLATVSDNQYILMPNATTGIPDCLTSCFAGNEKLYTTTGGNDPAVLEIDIANKTIFSYNYLDVSGNGSKYAMSIDMHGNILMSNTDGAVLMKNIGLEQTWVTSAYVAKG